MLLPRDDGRNLRLEEALQFLKGPDFLPVESQPARVEFNPDKSGLHFRFPTPCPCDFEENNVVYGRLYRCGERWQERPVIILLHGGSDFPNHRFGFPLIARRCNRAGFNAATLELPYHFQRRPRQHGVLTQVDYLRTSRALAQAVAEIRALTGWLLAEGCPAVALWGLSLGALLTGMTVCRDARPASVVMTASPDNYFLQVDQIFSRHGRGIPPEWRPALEALGMTRATLSSSQPVITKENILLIEGMYDPLVSSGQNELWHKWGQPEIWRLPHGHIGICSGLIPGLTGRVLRWLTLRLDTPTIRQHQMTPPNKSLQATGAALPALDGRSSSASRFTLVGPACLSSGR